MKNDELERLNGLKNGSIRKYSHESLTTVVISQYSYGIDFEK